MLSIIPLILGPVQTNAYLIADPASGEAAVIDPAWDGAVIMAEAARRGWRIGHLWLTHAHFDHFGGAAAIADGLDHSPVVAIHPADRLLWRAQGGAPLFGMRIDVGPEPDFDLQHGQILHLGGNTFEVRHTPGHTPGHVVYYCAAEKLVFCGDLIFRESIGRTDLPGGDYETIIESIRSQILSLPEDTRLLSGHGEATTVGDEIRYNPFLQ